MAEQTILNGGGGDLLEAFDAVVRPQVVHDGAPGGEVSLADEVGEDELFVGGIIDPSDGLFGDARFTVLCFKDHQVAGVLNNEALELGAVV